ncbi:MAG: MOSC domain-containing protein [Bacteroidetes bacterium]|nr:MOSC domain-containing protein [Bacteroidota bacterium]
MKSMDELMQQFPRQGKVAWIGLRPERKAALKVVSEAVAIADRGLEGDRKSEKKGGKRQVTLIQGEHLDGVASMLGIDKVDPGLTRRNIIVRGINLLSLKGQRFKIGEAELVLTDECHPCSRMEENLGPGGYNAMRGHGGWCAVVVNGGLIKVGDVVQRIAAVEKGQETASV